MGNIFSNSSTCSTSSTSSTAETNPLTDYDMKIYEDRRDKIFYGSIAVVILYAAIALLMLLGSYSFESIRFILFNRFLAFTIVFIIGTIIIALILAHQVYYFRPIKINKRYIYDDLSCPDYWNLKQLYDDDTGRNLLKKAFSSNIDINLFKYRCELNSNLFSSNDIYHANLTSHDGSSAATTNHFIYATNTGINDNLSRANLLSSRTSLDTSGNRIFANILDTKNSTNLKNIINAENTTSDVFKAFQGANIHANYIMNNYEYTSKNSNNPFSGGYYHNKLNLDDNWSSSITNDPFKPTSDDLTNGLKSKGFDKQYLDYNIITKDGYGATGVTINSGTHPIITPDLTAATREITKNTTNVNTVPVLCDRLYPSYLSALDNKLQEISGGRIDNNVMRCAYSKMCKVPWSEMNCDKYT